MLPPVESDEKLVAHGVYQQLRDDQPTGVQEYWTMHSLPDGATICRSQMLYDGVVPLSACYMIRDPENVPVQLVFYWRWDDEHEDMIEYRFAGRTMMIIHNRQAQEMILPPVYEVYAWHTITENLLWVGYNPITRGNQKFTIIAPGIHNKTLWPTTLVMDASYERGEILPGPDGPLKAATYAVDMPQLGPQHLSFDEFGIPLRWMLLTESMRVELLEYSRLA